jgi:hypothetical protein
MPIKSFRGKIADSTSDTIHLHTSDGSMGYRVVKFDIIPGAPITSDIEAVMKIESVQPTAFSNTIDFSNQELLGVAVWWGGAAGVSNPQDWIQIFDNKIFNQDIYVSGVYSGGSFQCNYYIELEQVKLDLNENTVATLKDIRNITAPT